MRSAILILLLALVGCVSAETGGQGRALMGFRRRAWCRAGSKLRIRVTSGSCSGTAQADCNALSKAFGQFSKDAKEWFANKNCQKNSLEAYAASHAKAVAQVLVTSQVRVQCKGQGYACGYAVAEGSALAKSVAQAQAQAFVDADPSGEHGSTFCDADVEALGEVYAQVAEKVRAHACQKGWGKKWRLSQRFNRSVQCAIATAYVRAEAGYCAKKGWGGYDQAKAWSKCTGRGEVLWLCRGY